MILEPHLFTVEEYMKLDIEARTELLGGVVYDVPPRNEPHRYAVRKLNQFLVRGLGSEYAVQIQDAVAVGGWRGKDAPEIDVAILFQKYYRPGRSAIKRDAQGATGRRAGVSQQLVSRRSGPQRSVRIPRRPNGSTCRASVGSGPNCGSAAVPPTRPR